MESCTNHASSREDKIPHIELETDTIELPDDIILTSNFIQGLINFVYPNINSHILDTDDFYNVELLHLQIQM
ncbi:4602_t:CDS:2 [Gigaspora margarita]|uniref:4602_t:CDS:1 n=1 Tax=Gigaspora margarita TaxID=4874 RepID=A0ABM8W2U5_GIGMA|nr:4602_t:CDS:2 [Gigaspora margarita]